MTALVEEIRTRRRLPPPRVAKAMRMAAGVSQQRLADELGVHRVTVARWEDGTRRPAGALLLAYLELLEQIAHAAPHEGGSAPPAPTSGATRVSVPEVA